MSTITFLGPLWDWIILFEAGSIFFELSELKGEVVDMEEDAIQGAMFFFVLFSICSI